MLSWSRRRVRALAGAAGLAVVLALSAGCTGAEKSPDAARSFVSEGLDEASSAVATSQLAVEQARAHRSFATTVDVTLEDQQADLVHATRHLAILVAPDVTVARLRDRALAATNDATAAVTAARDALAHGRSLAAPSARLDRAADELDAVTGQVEAS